MIQMSEVCTRRDDIFGAYPQRAAVEVCNHKGLSKCMSRMVCGTILMFVASNSV